MEEKARKAAWILHKQVCKDPGSYSENRYRFFKPSPASNVSSLSVTAARETERTYQAKVPRVMLSTIELEQTCPNHRYKLLLLQSYE